MALLGVPGGHHAKLKILVLWPCATASGRQGQVLGTRLLDVMTNAPPQPVGLHAELLGRLGHGQLFTQ
ncbi:MAG: hypothetical protein RLZZ352_2352 [Pseudomonadota bacterium]|jgi:hypothetical protein